MKSVFLLATFLIGLTSSVPVDPNDEVELVPIENTNQGDPELTLGGGGGGGGDFVPIIVLRTSNSPFGSGGFPSLFKTFFGSGDDGEVGLHDTFFPKIKDFHESLLPEINPKDFLTPVEETDEDEAGEESDKADGEKCDGLLCLLFKALGTRVKHIEDEIKEIQATRENAVEPEEKREPETTYEEKVLDDGTVIKINRTRYSDVSEDGSSYFGFHSTSFFSGGDGKDTEKDVEVQPKISEETTEAAASEAVETVNEDYDVEDDDKKPIKLVQKSDNVRRRRRRSDPFNQQQMVDRSYLNEVRQEKLTLNNRAKPEFRSLEGDTRVNDLLLENARRGGYIRTDPDAEFLPGYY